jgi:hypothetical protein
MTIDRRTLTGGAALLGVGASIGAAVAPGEHLDEGVAVQRVFDNRGRLVQVHASVAPSAPWVSLTEDD